MICTYYIEVTQFDNEALFQEKLSLLSPYRQQKIALLKHRKDKNRSIGAGLVLNYALGLMDLRSGAWSMSLANGANQY